MTRKNNEQTDKNKAISAAILLRVSAGESVDVAFDAVIGAGAYDQLVGDLYRALRAKRGV